MNKKYIGIIIILTCSFLLITSNTYSLSPQELYDLQEKCGKRCEEFFKKKYGDGIINNQEQSGVITYQNHYNKRLNKCFIIKDNIGFMKNNNNNYKRKSLFDINEKKDYGFFYNIGTFIICNVLEKKCKSEKEWDELVKSYMEE